MGSIRYSHIPIEIWRALLSLLSRNLSSDSLAKAWQFYWPPLQRPFSALLCTSPQLWNALSTTRMRIEPISCPACSRTHLGCKFLMLALGSSEFFFFSKWLTCISTFVNCPGTSLLGPFPSLLDPSFKQPDGWPYRCPDANAPTAVYDAYHGYYVVDSSTMSLGYSDVHNTPSNQGQGPHLTSNPYSAGTVDGSTQIRDHDITIATYDATNTAYGDASAAYAAINAAYAAGTNTGDLTNGIWPSTDPLSTLVGYDHGAADIDPGVYPLVPNPTLAPGNLTTTPVQAGYEPAVANTDGSRPRCSTCNTTFKRASDLVRHQKKHQARRAFKCLVPGCKFKGTYRKDKLDAHVKSCHPRGAA